MTEAVMSGLLERKEMTAGFRYYVISGNRYAVIAPSAVATAVKEGDNVNFLVSGGKIADICVSGTRKIVEQDMSPPSGTGQKSVPPPAGFVPASQCQREPAARTDQAMTCYQKDNGIILQSSLKVAAEIFSNSPEARDETLSFDDRVGIVEHGALRIAKFVMIRARDING